jgi:hypothetical protein
VAEAADARGEAFNHAAQPRVTTAGHRAVVGQRFGERHRDASADGGGQADKERGVRVAGGERGGEQRRKRRD